MTKKDKNSEKTVPQKELIKSMQELNLTLEALKVLTSHLKNQSHLASLKADNNTESPYKVTETNITDPYTMLHWVIRSMPSTPAQI